MILASCDEIPGRQIIKTLGLVRGNTIRARHIGRDIMAMLRGIVGGEVTDYTKMIAEAEKLGANAIVAVRFGTAEMMTTAAEILVYGTAVVIE
jgi:uncharacterized protein YbjQ (UPF0145 family)